MRNKYTAVIINHDSNDENLYYFWADNAQQVIDIVEDTKKNPSNCDGVFCLFEGFLEPVKGYCSAWNDKPEPMNIEDYHEDDEDED